MASKWFESSLGDLIEIKHGFAFNGEFFHDTPQGDILLTPGNFSIGGGFKADKIKYFDGPVPDEFILNPGDLLVTMTDLSKQADTLGYPAFVPSSRDSRHFLHNQRLGRIILKDERTLDLRFLYYLLCSDEYRHEILASATGTTVKHTSPDRIKQFRFLRPPLPTQHAIAHILGTLDDKIEVNRRMNETLEAMARAIFKSWFVDFDPVRAKAERRDMGLPKEITDLFPSRLVDSELGEIPEGWEVWRVANIGSVVCGKTPSTQMPDYYGDDLPFITIPDMHRKVFVTTTQKRLSWAGADSQKSKMLPAGAICVSCIATPGLVALTSEVAQTNQQINTVIPSKSNESYYWFWTLRNLGEEIRSGGSGGSVLANLSTGRFSDLHVLAPSAELRNSYGSLVEPFFNRILQIDHESRAIATVRDTLMPKLMSGELRVKDSDRFIQKFME